MKLFYGLTILLFAAFRLSFGDDGTTSENLLEWIESDGRFNQLAGTIRANDDLLQLVSQTKSVTLLAVPDQENWNYSAEFVASHLVIPGKWTTDRLRSERYLLPAQGEDGFSEWYVDANTDKLNTTPILRSLNNDGLPAGRVQFADTDILISNSCVHVLERLPKIGFMYRGGMLELSYCRQMLASAKTRMELWKKRGDIQAAAKVGHRLLVHLRDSTYDTYKILSTNSGKVPWQSSDGLPPVPPRAFVTANTGLLRGLIEKDANKRLACYEQAIVTTIFLTSKETMREVADGYSGSWDSQADAYQEAVDLARYTLRLEGLTDKMWRFEKSRTVVEPRRKGNSDTTSAAVREIMRYDKNADGRVSRDEVPEVEPSMPAIKPRRSLFVRFDLDRDGYLTPSEIASAISASRTRLGMPIPRRSPASREIREAPNSEGALSATATLKRQGTHRYFLKQLENNNLLDEFNSPGPWTIFAISDKGYEAFPYFEGRQKNRILNNQPYPGEGKTLRFYRAKGKFTKEVISKARGGYLYAETDAGSDIIISHDDAGYYVTPLTQDGLENGRHRLIVMDIASSNGIIHSVDSRFFGNVMTSVDYVSPRRAVLILDSHIKRMDYWLENDRPKRGMDIAHSALERIATLQKKSRVPDGPEAIRSGRLSSDIMSKIEKLLKRDHREQSGISRNSASTKLRESLMQLKYQLEAELQKASETVEGR